MNQILAIILGLGAWAVIATATAVLLTVFAKSEGRFMIKRGFSGPGLDLLSYNPMNRSIRMRAVKWDGDYWVNKNEATYTGFDPLINPEKPAEKAFNESLQQAAHWEGSKRPVLLGSEELCFIFPPDFNTQITKIKNENSEDYQKVEKVVDRLEKLFDMGIQRVSFNTPLNANDILDFVEGATPKAMREQGETGIAAGILSMTKKRGELPGLGTIAIGLGTILLIIFVVVFIQKGGLERIMPNLAGCLYRFL